MYVILVYDVEARRTTKLLKLCRQYLHWIQNSVFEGELRPSQLEELLQRADELMEDDDSLIIFKSREGRWLEKKIIGTERNSTDNFI